MDEKFSFILEWHAGDSTFVELCRAFGISRTLGYRYLHRYWDGGPDALQTRSSSPGRAWNRTDEDLERAVVALRRENKRFGALKIREFLQEHYGNRRVPAVSTIELILKRNGLVKKRRQVRRIREVHPIFDPQKPNEIWSADFKGEFRMGNMRYCYPLTVRDSYSRYVLGVQGMHRPTFEGTRAVFQALFEEYGLPEQIHTDNGEPFASAVSLSRLTRLAVWFIDLGIVPVYSDPGHPEQNGRHERMHRELKADATRPPGYSLGRQQQKFDEFRQQYNDFRPHQALGQRRPQQVYYRSARQYKDERDVWDYPQGMDVRYVSRNGAIRWGVGKWVMVSTTLIEKYIGLEQFTEDMWRVYYRNMLLGYLDGKSLRIRDDQGRLRRTDKKCKQCA
jgi:transposase InsO family protein